MAGKKPPGRKGGRKPKPPAVRKPGRQKAMAPVLGAAEQALIAELYLRHRPVTEIANQLQVDESTIRYHLASFIKPAWRVALSAGAEQEVARVDLIEKLAWEQFDKAIRRKSEVSIRRELEPVLKQESQFSRDGEQPQLEKLIETAKKKLVGAEFWIRCIQWCVDYRSRVLGYYRTAKIGEVDVRVAGRSREDLEQGLKDRIEQLLQRRRDRITVEGEIRDVPSKGATK